MTFSASETSFLNANNSASLTTQLVGQVIFPSLLQWGI